jgi:hypothetical protein
MNRCISATRSIFSSLPMLVCASIALVGCKSGGGGSTDAAAAASTSSSPAVAVTPAPAAAAPAPAPAPAPVSAANTAPKITGSTIASVKADSLYSFKPSASDADGDPLAFQIQNKPAWAAFNTATGQLSGTPTTAQAGTFANIVISVSDGKSATSMPAFSISVTQTAVANAAALSWVAPTQNTDGSTLTDLAGYTIVYGTSQAAMDQIVRIDNAKATTWSMDSFPTGTYYFAIKAFTAGGAESALSGIATKVFN